MRIRVSLFVFVICLAMQPAIGAPDDALPPHRDGVILLRFQPTTAPDRQNAIFGLIGASLIKQIGVQVLVLNVGSGNVTAVLNLLKPLNELFYAEPDYAVLPLEDVKPHGGAPAFTFADSFAAPSALSALSAAPLAQGMSSGALPGALPNDTFITSQWAVQNTGQTVNGDPGTAGADERSLAAWSVTTGINSVVVAVLDTGVQYSHPDLYTNLWINPGGIGGCAAGTHGYNVLTHLCDPMDDDVSYGGHGSHVAGILGAVGNNATGVAGVNWTTTILPVKWVDMNSNGFTSDLISAMDWVVAAKQAGVNVRVANNSPTWQGTAFSQALSDEIDLLGTNDILFVAAAGNTAQNNDIVPRYPCSYNRPTMICVAASDQNDNLATFSNYGTTSVKLAAPGVDIYSTLRSSNYGYINGASMSAAQVSGAAAMVLSRGYLTVANLRSQILSNVDVLPSLTSWVATGGRLNVCKAVPGCSSASTAIPANVGLPTISGALQYGSLLGASTGMWSGAPTAYSYQWFRCGSNGSNCSPIPGAKVNSYAVLAAADLGATIAVSVTASNTSGSTTIQSAVTTAIATGASSFAVNSSVTDGQIVTGSLSWHVNPAQAVNFVQFYVDGVLSQTVSSSPYTYILDSTTLSNGAHVLGVRALAADNRTYVFSGAGVTVANSPVNTVLPAISGTPAQGQMLATSNGTWTNNPTSYSYKWQRCNSSGSNCLDIAGATTNSYAVVLADVGSTLRSSVTATNSSGSGTAVSAVTAVVGSSVSITTTSLPAGQQNTAYSTTVAATGGTTPYTWSLASGTLPAGLTLAAATGVISGTPTGTGTSTFTIQVKDANSQTATKALSIQINAGSGGGIALVQSNAVEGSGLTSISTPFPGANTAGNLIIAFVRMSSTTQTVTLTDSGGNTYVEAVAQIQHSDGHQVHVFYAKNIVGGANTLKAAFSATNNHPWLAVFEYSGLSTTSPLDQTASAEGSGVTPSVGPTAVTTSANELIFAATGNPSGYPGTTSPGSGYTLGQQDTGTSRGETESAIVTSTNAFTASFSCSISTNWTAVIATFAASSGVSGLSITTTSLPAGQQNTAYSTTVAATGGTTPYAWSLASGTLPAGLTLAAATGVISGTPTGTGTSNFTIQVKDANSQTATAALSITIAAATLTITTTSLPAGQRNTAYSTTVAATGGTTPYTWSLASGTLPAGLTLAAATGVISGTPTGTGTSNFTIQVKDVNSQTATKALSIQINAGSGGGIALVQSNAVEGSGLTSISTPFPGANTAGNLIIAFVRMSSTTQTVTLTDSAGNTYVEAVAQIQHSDGHQVHLFYAKNIVGGANTLKAAFSATNNHPWLAVFEYSGLSTTSPLDQTASAEGSGVTPTAGPTAVTTSANELIFVATGNPSGYPGTTSPGSGYTLGQQDTGTSRGETASAIATSTGAFTATFSCSVSTNWTAVIATFKP